MEYTDKKGRPTLKTDIGEVVAFPYEMMYDCSAIPDQSLGRLSIRCQVFDNAGNDVESPPKEIPLVLDRNLSFKEIELKSNYSKKKIVVDGLLDEWDCKDTAIFLNNDNRILVFLQWDAKYLYVAAFVKDKSVISHFKKGDRSGSVIIDGRPIAVSYEDDIELFFDPEHNHRMIRDKSHKQFLFSPAGMFFQVTIDSMRQENNFTPDILCGTRVYGTLNNDQDQDTGYAIETAIPWKILGITSFNDRKLGLEVWNDDKDFLNGDYFYSSWSGVEARDLHNPSEWGNIRLVNKPKSSLIALIFITVIVAVTGAGMFLRRYLVQKQAKPADQTILENSDMPLDKEEVIFANALKYIKDNFTKDISVEDVVKEANTNHTTFSKIFKAKTGQTFVQYLIQMRLERAKYLLKNSKLSITEVMLESGFNGLQYFNHAFHKDTGMSPLQYRNSNS